MELTVTAKILLKPTQEQQSMLLETGRAFSRACNYISGVIFDTRNLNQAELQKQIYGVLRADYGMPSQMACNAVRHVIGNYRAILANQEEWIKPDYRHTTYALSWNRDYLLRGDYFSVGTIGGRVKMPYKNGGMEKYFDGTWTFGVARVVNKHGKWYLHIAMSKEFDQLNDFEVGNVVGVDLGINFTAVAYDSKGKTTFYSGKQIKHKRGQYKKIRQQLQKRRTASARRRLAAIGSRENRWISDVNHRISKALVDGNPKNTVFVFEDLTGIRNVTEKVRVEDRYVSVSWAFFDLRQKLEYKAKINGGKIIIANPKHTSQTCPKCGHAERANRNKRKHTFKCKNCGYTSNDDRIGAMNLHKKGIEYLSAVAGE